MAGDMEYMSNALNSLVRKGVNIRFKGSQPDAGFKGSQPDADLG